MTPFSIPARRLVLAALLTGAGLLGPGVAAQAAVAPCVPDHCDSLLEYYSDSTYTVRVGEYEDGPCGQIDNGVHTQYVRRFVRTC